jgi:hypothetical protein
LKIVQTILIDIVTDILTPSQNLGLTAFLFVRPEQNGGMWIANFAQPSRNFRNEPVPFPANDKPVAIAKISCLRAQV